jgi:hypothetical protein
MFRKISCAKDSGQFAAYALVVDAKDDTAAKFYRHHGFLETASEPLTLFLPLATVPVPI